MARILVGIPTYNRPDYVRETLRSVLEQSVRELRVVITDNVSEPEVSRSVQEHVQALGDPRVRYFLQPHAIKEYGQGRYLFGSVQDEDYFVIQHDDDLMEPGYLEAAVHALDSHPEADCSFANPLIIDSAGAVAPELTRLYLEQHGRHRLTGGLVEILEPMLRWGIIPICGTVFRVSALRASGFVDPVRDRHFPFELEVLLRLGSRGARAWFLPRQLMRFRYHEKSLRVGAWFDPATIDAFIELLEQFRFDGRCERVRRKLIGSKCRRAAELHLSAGDAAACRQALLHALRANVLSWRSWLLLGGATLCPIVLRPMLRSRIAAGSRRATFS